MKAALVFDGLGFGGIERVGVSYAKLFHELGYEVDVYNLKPEKTEMEKEFGDDCNIFHCKLPLFFTPDYYMLMVKRWWWGKYLYPIIYIVSTLLMFIYRFLRGKRKKYDVTVAFSGHFRDLTFVAYEFIKGKKKLCWLHGALMEYMVLSCTFGDLYRKIKNLCVLSEDRQEAALDANKYLIKELNIKKLYNPMFTEKKKTDLEVVNDIRAKYGKYLLMVGRFEQDKDQKTVIEAFKILKEKYNRTEKLVFVGNGSTLEECKNYAKQLKLSEDVFFVGARYDVENFYTTAGVFIHSSKAEGLPTVLLEAMVYEVPIVATDSPPGVTEILGNDNYGVRCAIGNPKDMADKVNKLLVDYNLRKNYIEQGKKRIADFDFNVIKNELGDILRALV